LTNQARGMPEKETAFWRKFVQVIVLAIVQPRSTRVARVLVSGMWR